MRSRVLVAVAVLAAATAASARAGTVLLVTGHGWGHGVGMSQWGAYGYARHGWKYERILTHYYPGTTLERVHQPQVRVLLIGSTKTVTVGCKTRFKADDSHSRGHSLPAGSYGLGPKLVLPVRKNGLGRSIGSVAVFECGHAPLTLDGRPYHGILLVRSSHGRLSVVNYLSLDAYVRGVVPCESPSRWPIAELEAQAVAARSYALAELKPDAQYDLLPDTRDQVYGGVHSETVRSNRAVAETAGQVLEWQGKVARTYYSSSSGGRTESVQDAWPGARPIPYLRSVPDPYDTFSPNHDWGPVGLSPSALGARLGLGSSVTSVHVVRNGSFRVATVDFRLADGSVVSRSGEQIARTLGLRSTWFSVGRLSLWTSRARVLYGDDVRVFALASGEKGVLLQERNANGWWKTVRHLDHGTTVSVTPRGSTTFRLVARGTKGTTVDVAVAPRLRVMALGPRLLGGSVSPRTGGTVTVWHMEKGGWAVVAHPILGSDGDFETRMHLQAGAYRVAVAPNAGLASTQTRLLLTRRQILALAP